MNELSLEKFNKIKYWYWVPVYKRGERSISKSSFTFSRFKPSPVPNPEMEWVHPTWIELIEYQKVLTKEEE